MRKIKKLTTTKAKSNAWKAFSKYIRLRDAIKTTGTKTHVVCITCGKTYKAFGVGCAQAGHFISGRKNSVLIDERFVNAQCYNCNINLKGNWVVYEQKMIEKYGRGEVELAKLMSRQVLPRKVFEWLEIKTKYEELYNKLNDRL